NKANLHEKLEPANILAFVLKTSECCISGCRVVWRNGGSDSAVCAVSDVAAAEDKVKFTPGKKQSKFETLMTKEEIEEEQRVQQEQLAAIFLLLRENQEALGEVTEGDMEEQLKLYSL
uniref:Si:ch73-366l1.5 n=1 Tax=Lates calcarifer TaxID=8187 RepID=A0A4W6FGG5_LATCA